MGLLGAAIRVVCLSSLVVAIGVACGGDDPTAPESASPSSSSGDAVLSRSDTEEAFRLEELPLTPALNLEKQSRLLVLYLSSAAASGDEVIYVAVYDGVDVAAEYATAEASPVGEKSTIRRVANVVVYLPQGLPAETGRRVASALERLRAKVGSG
jgi:hypothetical protein